MYRQHFRIIGVSDDHMPAFSGEVMEIIRYGKVFSGGRRHHELIAGIIDPDSEWIDITVPLADVFERYRNHDSIVVFASGDPLFYGFASTLMREFPDAEINVFPTFNSLQMLAHRLLLPYEDMVCTSLTGRPWKNLDDKLIKGCDLIGVLTDGKKGPREIASRMLQYGYDNYSMSIGETLGNRARERVRTLSPEEVADMEFAAPNCVILKKNIDHRRYFGIPELEFCHLEGRENMITKMPVRLLSLSMLDLGSRRSFWDIGFCTGSVSIEARLQFPHIDITAFERREESRGLMKENYERFGAPGIESVIGDFMEIDVSGYPSPDAVFIGGHGGRLVDMVKKIRRYLNPGGVIVFNSVSEMSCRMFGEAAELAGMSVVETHRVVLDNHNPINIMKAQ